MAGSICFLFFFFFGLVVIVFHVHLSYLERSLCFLIFDFIFLYFCWQLYHTLSCSFCYVIIDVVPFPHLNRDVLFCSV